MISPMPVRITGFFGSREAYMRYMSYVEAKFQKSFAIDASFPFPSGATGDRERPRGKRY